MAQSQWLKHLKQHIFDIEDAVLLCYFVLVGASVVSYLSHCYRSRLFSTVGFLWLA